MAEPALQPLEKSREFQSLIPPDFRKKLQEKFILRGILGAGGMGVVIRGVHRDLERDVAIKVQRRDQAIDSLATERILYEAKVLSKIEHPRVVRIFDFEVTDDLVCLAVEFLPGRDLVDYLNDHGTLPVDQALEFCEQILDGLGAIHDLKVVHRDLKPANLLLDAQNEIRIADFGLAASPDRGFATQQGVILGTPRYMAPEQIRGEPPVPGTDLYALGVILFEMLTGQPVFDAKSDKDLLIKHLRETPAGLTSVDPNLPLSVDRLCLSLLQKDPKHRPGSAREVLESIRLIRSRPQSASLARPPSGRTSLADPEGTRAHPSGDLSAPAATGAIPRSGATVATPSQRPGPISGRASGRTSTRQTPPGGTSGHARPPSSDTRRSNRTLIGSVRTVVDPPPVWGRRIASGILLVVLAAGGFFVGFWRPAPQPAMQLTLSARGLQPGDGMSGKRVVLEEVDGTILHEVGGEVTKAVEGLDPFDGRFRVRVLDGSDEIASYALPALPGLAVALPEDRILGLEGLLGSDLRVTATDDASFELAHVTEVTQRGWFRDERRSFVLKLTPSCPLLSTDELHTRLTADTKIPAALEEPFESAGVSDQVSTGLPRPASKDEDEAHRLKQSDFYRKRIWEALTPGLQIPATAKNVQVVKDALTYLLGPKREVSKRIALYDALASYYPAFARARRDSYAELLDLDAILGSLVALTVEAETSPAVVPSSVAGLAVPEYWEKVDGELRLRENEMFQSTELELALAAIVKDGVLTPAAGRPKGLEVLENPEVWGSRRMLAVQPPEVPVSGDRVALELTLWNHSPDVVIFAEIAGVVRLRMPVSNPAGPNFYRVKGAGMQKYTWKNMGRTSIRATLEMDRALVGEALPERVALQYVQIDRTEPREGTLMIVCNARWVPASAR